MTNSFDSKVYDIIKGEEETEKLSFDDIYPVGSIIRISTKNPPSKGTWELVGIYGNVYNDDESTGQIILNTFHFKGKSAIAISRWIKSTTGGTDYYDHFGQNNYVIKTVLGIHGASNEANETLYYAHDKDNAVFRIKVDGQGLIFLDFDTPTGAVTDYTVSSVINITDINQVPVQDGLSFEYKRTH